MPTSASPSRRRSRRRRRSERSRCRWSEKAGASRPLRVRDRPWRFRPVMEQECRARPGSLLHQQGGRLRATAWLVMRWLRRSRRRSGLGPLLQGKRAAPAGGRSRPPAWPVMRWVRRSRRRSGWGPSYRDKSRACRRPLEADRVAGDALGVTVEKAVGAGASPTGGKSAAPAGGRSRSAAWPVTRWVRRSRRRSGLGPPPTGGREPRLQEAARGRLPGR